MKSLDKFVRELSSQDKKTLSQKALKVSEEVGELAKVVLPFDNASGTIHRFIDRKRILEEVADVHLTAISIAYSLDFTDDEIEDMIMHKAKKWADIQKAEAKIQGNIPYEIHVTVNLVADDTVNFVESCRKIDVKPIVLALQTKGQDITDVMTSSVHLGNNRTAYDEMKRISDELARQGFKVVREKIETVPWHPAAPSPKNSSIKMPEDCYFETHIGVNLSVTDNDRKKALQDIADYFEAHMSRNAFKMHNDGTYMQMITLRKYEGTFEAFEGQANMLNGMIVLEGFEVEKRVTEFSIYDTKVSHDSAWLTKEPAEEDVQV